MAALRCLMVAGWVGSLAMCASAVGQDASLTTIAPAEAVYDWVVENASGRIFASSPWADLVMEYDPATGKEVRRLAVAGNPAELIIKRQWLVAGCAKTASLSVIDWRTGKVLGAVQLTGNGPYGLFCSRADNPYAYAICSMGNAQSDGEVFQIDLAKLQVRKRAHVQPWRQPYPTHIAMSADGKWMVPDAHGRSIPHGACLMGVDEEACTFQDVAQQHPGFGQRLLQHESFGPVVADPSGRWWTLGNRLFPLDLRAPVRKFTGSPVAIHPKLDLVASLNGTQLCLETFTDAKLLKSLSLPAAPDGPQTAAKRPTRMPMGSPMLPGAPAGLAPGATHDPTVQFDLAGNRVVCAYGSRAHVLSLSDLGVTIKPRLEVLAPTRISVSTGQTQRVPLAVRDPARFPSLALQLVSGPAFAKLEGKQLVLSPGTDDVGQHDVVVKASQADLSDTLTVAVSVTGPGVDLGFIARGVAVDREGKCAVAWGTKARHGFEVPGPGFAMASEFVTAPTEFAVIDLDRPKVLGTQPLSTGIQLLLVDDKYVYLTVTSGNVLYRLDRGDLTKRSRVFLSGQPQRLAATLDKHLAVLLTSDSQPAVHIYDRETLQRNAKHWANRVRVPPFGLGAHYLYDAVDDGAVRCFERILDARTGATRCLQGPVNLPPLVTVNRQPAFHGMAGESPRLWGRTLTDNTTTLASTQGSRIAALRDMSFGASVISPDYPLWVRLRATMEPRHHQISVAPDRWQISLEYRDLKQGEVIQSSLIDTSDPSRTALADPSGRTQQFWLAKDKVVVPRGNRVLVFPIPAAVRKNLPLPLMLKYPHIPVAPVDKPLEVQLASAGGEGKRTYSLLSEYEGLALDAGSGRLTVDLPLLWKNYLARLRKPASGFSPEEMPGIYRRDGGIDTDSKGDAERKSDFEKLTGEPLPAGKMALAVPLDVGVSDDAGQQDRLSFSLIVLAPADEHQKLVAARRAELERLREQARLEAQRRDVAVREMGRVESAEAKPAGDRIGQLENRVRRLEAAVDTILQKLDRLEKSAPGRP